MGPHGPRFAASDPGGTLPIRTEHLTGASRGPDLVGRGRLTCYGIGRLSELGDFPPAHHRAEQGHPPSTRRAQRPLGGAGLRSGLVRGSRRSSGTRPAGQRYPSGERARSVRGRTRKRTTACGPSGFSGALDTSCYPERGVRTQPFESMGLWSSSRKMLHCNSNKAATVFFKSDVATPAREYEEDDNL